MQDEEEEESEHMRFRDLSWPFPCLWSFTQQPQLYERWACGYRSEDTSCLFDSVPFTLRTLRLNVLSLFKDDMNQRISTLVMRTLIVM